MESTGGESFRADIHSPSRGTGIAHLKQIRIIRVVSESTQEDLRIQPRTVMMNLAFDSSYLPSKPITLARCIDFLRGGHLLEIPETPSIAVPAPMWNIRHVREDTVDGLFHGLVHTEMPSQ